VYITLVTVSSINDTVFVVKDGLDIADGFAVGIFPFDAGGDSA
jgi:hypothetical protein